MQYAAHIEVDNSEENPDEGRRGLQEELLPVLQSLPGFDSTLLMTNYEQGRGVAVVVFESRDAASALVSGLSVGQEIRAGVTVTRAEVLEINARA